MIVNLVGMLVILIRGVNRGFSFHLGCSGQNATIYSHQTIFHGTLTKRTVTSALKWYNGCKGDRDVERFVSTYLPNQQKM